MTRLRQALLLLSLLLSACSADQPPQEVEARQSVWEGPVPPVAPRYQIDLGDSSCRTELEQARTEVKRGQLTYYQRGWFRYAHDLDTLLHEHGIGFAFEPMPCTSDGDCYSYYMDSVITRVHGADFIARLKQAAQQRFLSQWRTRHYRYTEVDESPTSPVGDVDAYITTHLPRPQGWDTAPKTDSIANFAQRQYLFLRFTIDSTGQVGKPQLETDLLNIKASNRRFLPYFQREIRRLLPATGPWQPGRLAGHRVACTYYLDVTLNPEL